jgi:hypothetical protein
MVLGAPLHLPGELLDGPEPPRTCFTPSQPRTCSYAETVASPPPHLAQARHVYVRRGGRVPPLSRLYVGPYEVLHRNAKTFTLRVGEKEEIFSVDCLKAHTGPAPLLPASPPLRGRPPACPLVQPASL